MVGIVTIVLLTVTVFTKWGGGHTKLNNFWRGVLLNIADCNRWRESACISIYMKCEIGIGIGVVLKDLSRKYKCSSNHTR
jgi:hypothetical protein